MKVADFGTELIKVYDGKEAIVLKDAQRLSADIVGLSSAKILYLKKRFPKLPEIKKVLETEIKGQFDKSFDWDVFSKKESESFDSYILMVAPTFNLQAKILTADIVGGFCSGLSLSRDFQLLDIGASKTSLLIVKDGQIEDVILIRQGIEGILKNPLPFKQRLLSSFEDGKVFLCGGGAFSQDVLKILGEIVEFEIPYFPEFASDTPLFFNAYGLYNLKKLKKFPAFKRGGFDLKALLSEKTFSLAVVLFCLSSFSLSVAQLLNYIAKSGQVQSLDSYAKKLAAEVIEGKVVAPEAQLEDALQTQEAMEKFLLSDKDAVDVLAEFPSVANGVKIISVQANRDSLKVEGRAGSQKKLESLVRALKKDFDKVIVSANPNGGKVYFKIKAQGAKVEGS